MSHLQMLINNDLKDELWACFVRRLEPLLIVNCSRRQLFQAALTTVFLLPAGFSSLSFTISLICPVPIIFAPSLNSKAIPSVKLPAKKSGDNILIFAFTVSPG
jgi:hypothetical protein